MHRCEIHSEIVERTLHSTLPFLYLFCIPGYWYLFSLLRELVSTSDLENSIKSIVYCSVQVVTRRRRPSVDRGTVISNIHDHPC